MPLLGQDLSGSLSRRIAILGPGLIGGSLALALSRVGQPWQVSVWARREEAALEAAALLPRCHVSCDLASVLADCDIAVLCMSPQAIQHCGEDFKTHLPASATITDAGSVKANIVETLEITFGGRFIGAHPMAGSDQSGIQAARADLFEGATCILTPTPQSEAKALEITKALWTATGCKLREMSPQNHDRAVGRISHLPHAAASCLVHAALAQDPTLADLAGPGYRDSTRVAGGPEGMWTEILFDNRLEVMKGIRDLQNTLETLKLALERGERQGVEAILADARKLRSNHPITK